MSMNLNIACGDLAHQTTKTFVRQVRGFVAWSFLPILRLGGLLSFDTYSLESKIASAKASAKHYHPPNNPLTPLLAIPIGNKTNALELFWVNPFCILCNGCLKRWRWKSRRSALKGHKDPRGVPKQHSYSWPLMAFGAQMSGLWSWCCSFAEFYLPTVRVWVQNLSSHAMSLSEPPSSL